MKRKIYQMQKAEMKEIQDKIRNIELEETNARRNMQLLIHKHGKTLKDAYTLYDRAKEIDLDKLCTEKQLAVLKAILVLAKIEETQYILVARRFIISLSAFVKNVSYVAQEIDGLIALSRDTVAKIKNTTGEVKKQINTTGEVKKQITLKDFVEKVGADLSFGTMGALGETTVEYTEEEHKLFEFMMTLSTEYEKIMCLLSTKTEDEMEDILSICCKDREFISHKSRVWSALEENANFEDETLRFLGRRIKEITILTAQKERGALCLKLAGILLVFKDLAPSLRETVASLKGYPEFYFLEWVFSEKQKHASA